MRVLIPLADGVEELEAVTVADVLRRGKVEVTLVSVAKKAEVETSHGSVLKADALWDDVDLHPFDAIVLPGGGQGTQTLMEDTRVIDTVKGYDKAGKFVCAICAAPMVLARAGVLQNRKATCYPTCAETLGKSYQDATVIVDNNIITSQGPGTALPFALVLLHHFVGERIARQVASGMLTTY